MAKEKWKLSAFLYCLLLLIPKLTDSREARKCSLLSTLQRSSVLKHGLYQFCDSPDSCKCRGGVFSHYCYFGEDCEVCLYNTQQKNCKDNNGLTSPPDKSDMSADDSTCKDEGKFMCDGKCELKIWKKECDGKCITRTDVCEAEGNHCRVSHTPNAIDWNCGGRCRNTLTKEKSPKFNCGGLCRDKLNYKECGNKCMKRSELCYIDGDPCKVKHQTKSTDWKCGTECKKKEYENDYKDCNGKCLFNYQTCNTEKIVSPKVSTEANTPSSTSESTGDEDQEEQDKDEDEIKDKDKDKDKEDNKNLKDEDNDIGFEIPAIIIAVLFAFILIGVIVFFAQKKKETRKKSVTIKYLPGDIPEHRILEKNDDLLDTISQAAKEKTPNKEEFKAIQEYVRVNINEAKTIGMQEENKNRNRYHDILPYNSNIVNLKKPTGDPPLTYMSASMITFPDFGQNFIAIQAPKENMFSSFWQMIYEQEISTIVMITGLVEGRKTKAHKYWPDMEDQDFELDNGFKLKYITHSFHGTYYQRQITLTDANGKERNIEQLQTTAWLDMTAPKDTKVLLDLIYKARELAGDPNVKNTAKRKSNSPKTKRSKKCPILVHCSAGVGRTGTFIALYKLVADYDNERVKTLDLFSTVVKMREQRMNMVQKYEQYHYIIKCLHHYIIAQTDIYQA